MEGLFGIVWGRRYYSNRRGRTGKPAGDQGCSWKSAVFSVHNAASLAMAMAAIARSISRPRARLSPRYSCALSSASRGPNTIALSDGKRASCAAISAGRRGPRSHCTRQRGQESRSPRSITPRSAGAQRFGPVRLSIRTEVSRTITKWSAGHLLCAPCVVQPVHGRHPWLAGRESGEPVRQKPEAFPAVPARLAGPSVRRIRGSPRVQSRSWAKPVLPPPPGDG